MYINVNGTRLFYEKVGNGKPIILLHGNGGNHNVFDELVEDLEKDFTVYAIDSRGHGLSDKVNEYSYDVMADDVASFIKQLNIEKPILYGFSDGGIIGLIIAYRYPRLLSKLIASGANATPEGIKPKIIRRMKFSYFFKKSPLIKLMLTEPNITVENLNRIKIPVVLLAGKNDLIIEGHTLFIAGSIKKGEVQILRGETHGSYIVHSKKIYEVLKPYIDNNPIVEDVEEEDE